MTFHLLSQRSEGEKERLLSIKLGAGNIHERPQKDLLENLGLGHIEIVLSLTGVNEYSLVQYNFCIVMVVVLLLVRLINSIFHGSCSLKYMYSSVSHTQPFIF